MSRRASTPLTLDDSVPAHASFGRNKGNGGISLEKIKCPTFSGKIGDYPSWKDEWQEIIHSRMDPQMELVKLRDNVPADSKVELKNLKSLKEAWEFLDDEYGDPERLTAAESQGSP